LLVHVRGRGTAWLVKQQEGASLDILGPLGQGWIVRPMVRNLFLISEDELAKRRKALEAAGGYKYPASQTPWQEIQRAHVGQMGTGMVLENAVKYQKIDQTMGIPRDNH